MLTVPARCFYPNNAIRFLTLVRVPAAHPVELADDWMVGRSGEYGLLRDVAQELKRSLSEWTSAWSHPELPTASPRLRCRVPQMILGSPLPQRHVRWTKDVRLLYRGDLRRARRKEAAE